MIQKACLSFGIRMEVGFVSSPRPHLWMSGRHGHPSQLFAVGVVFTGDRTEDKRRTMPFFFSEEHQVAALRWLSQREIGAVQFFHRPQRVSAGHKFRELQHRPFNSELSCQLISRSYENIGTNPSFELPGACRLTRIKSRLLMTSL